MKGLESAAVIRRRQTQQQEKQPQSYGADKERRKNPRSSKRLHLFLFYGLFLLLFAFIVLRIRSKFNIKLSEINFQPGVVKISKYDRSIDETVFRDEHDSLSRGYVKYQGGIFGPESLAFDDHLLEDPGHLKTGGLLYTGLSDGRVVRWNNETKAFETFAHTSPHRSPMCDYNPKTGPAPNLPLEPVCGRPLGIRFHSRANQLIVADAYFGLLALDLAPLVVSPKGTDVAHALVMTNKADGVPFKFTNDLDVDEDNDYVYFTDTSAKYERRHFLVAILEGINDGRLLRYSFRTWKTEVLRKRIRFANGVALSRNKDFVIFCETTMMRCLRYWLSGPKEGKSELFANLPGFPDNVRLNPRGNFWVAIHARRNSRLDWLFGQPWARSLLLRLLPDTRLLYFLLIGKPHGMIVELDGETGKVVRVLEDRFGKVVRAVSEVEERVEDCSSEQEGFGGGGIEGKKCSVLYMASVLMPHITAYEIPLA